MFHLLAFPSLTLNSQWRPSGNQPVTVLLKKLWSPLTTTLGTCMRAYSLSHIPLCDSMYRSPPGPSGHKFSRTPEWVAISYSRGSSRPSSGIQISWVSCITGGFFTITPPGKHWEHAHPNSTKLPAHQTLQSHPCHLGPQLMLPTQSTPDLSSVLTLAQFLTASGSEAQIPFPPSQSFSSLAQWTFRPGSSW